MSVLFATVLVGIGVALTYHIFENVVHSSIARIWYTWLQTDSHRLLVIPAAVVLGLLYFWLQHMLDPRSEKHQEKGLGETPKLTAQNYAMVLFLGYFSLVAGASLGPEAVLVPACTILGGYVGLKFFQAEASAVKLLTGAGLIALFAAFFNSFVVGLLTVLLLKKKSKAKIDAWLLLVAVIASGTTVLMLKLLEGQAYAKLPPYSWHINLATIFWVIVLFGGGYVALLLLSRFQGWTQSVQAIIAKKEWWQRALVAAFGLSILYLAGGHLVEFTGNLSIVPMFEQAASLGVIGLVWVLIIKLAAIAWSQSLHYRGGLIFPSIFVASILIAIVQLHVKDFNLIYGLIAAMAGMIVADRKRGALF